MKIIEKQNFVKVEGDIEVQKFGFIFNAKMVTLLSDSLYQNKILAIVRELSTNALDSQTENNNADKPFDVHLPTWNDMYFSIRDYGTGMSPERVENIYRNYGGSDRTDSNEFVGGMGLGSKTPFCYHTKTFSIDVWHDGIHYCYSAYIGEDGIPCIALMSQESSTDPSGVKIKLPVKKYDDRDFALAAQKIYAYFPVKPNIYGNHVDINPPNYILEGDDSLWKLRSEDHNGCRIIMGNVAYPLNFSDSNITGPQRNVMASNFDIFVDIGSVSVDIGREGLSYDNRTKVKVRYLINRIVSDFNNRMSDEINTCANLWEARKKCADLSGATSIHIGDTLKLEYKGRKLFDSLNNTIVFDSFIKAGDVEIVGYYDHSHYRSASKHKINSINVKKKYLFYENDLKTGGFVRAAYMSKKEGLTALLFKFKDDAARKAIIEYIGFDDSYFNKISTIPSPTIRQQGAKKEGLGRVVTLNRAIPAYSKGRACFWSSESDFDFNNKDSYVYVEFNRYRFKKDGLFQDPRSLAMFVDKCEVAGIVVPTIFGIKTCDIKRIKKNNAGQINFFDYVEKEISKKVSQFNMEEIIFYKNQISRRPSRENRIDFSDLEPISLLCKTSNLFTEYVNKAKHASIMSKKFDEAVALNSLATLFEIKTNAFVPPADFDLDKTEREVYNKYELLKILNPYKDLDKNDFLAIAKYVDLFEKE